MAKSIKKQRQRILREFKEIKSKERRNPQTIRRLIYDILKQYFDGNLHVAATRLNKNRVAHKGRNYKTQISQEGLYSVSRDRQWIKYLLLEALAIELKVPVSVLLFYTRLRSEQEERDNGTRARAMIKGFSAVVSDAKRKMESSHRFDFNDLREWLNLYEYPETLEAPEGELLRLARDRSL
ncbi:hypothetical protein [Pseudolabrys sp.]|uniref:hypothetical protein n=1 Tax=Pseudolabrys sp. TaxID=1960880 RepID=UPI003D0E8393